MAYFSSGKVIGLSKLDPHREAYYAARPQAGAPHRDREPRLSRVLGTEDVARASRRRAHVAKLRRGVTRTAAR